MQKYAAYKDQGDNDGDYSYRSAGGHSGHYHPCPSPGSRGYGSSRRSGRINHMLYVVIAVLFIGILITAVNVYELKQIHRSHSGELLPTVVEGTPEGRGGEPNGKALWVWGKKVDSGYLSHVLNVFYRSGYKRVREGDKWDVLWSHDYPFVKLKEHMVDLKPHQKVNHFPGSGFITNKVSLVTSNLTHTPKSFRMPKEREAFLKFVSNHPDYLWVQKGNNHRGVKITQAEDLDLSTDDTFIQRYIDEPLLVDGRRFDIGVYVTLTSVDPLRVYIYDGDWLVRFCPTVYYPFDSADRNKYVVGDDYMPVWKMPSLKHLYTHMGYGFRDSLLTHLASQGHDTDRLITQMFESITEVYLDKESQLINAASSYKTTSNFFEMVRFDFVIDNKMNVYLMEVNMSPNLSSSHHPPNKLMYEQVMYTMLSLVGVIRGTPTSYQQSTEDEQRMLVASKDISVNPRLCTSHQCMDSCMLIECKVCARCMSVQQADVYRAAYLEHLNRHTWKRLVPIPYATQDSALQWTRSSDPTFSHLSRSNQLLSLWYLYKCRQDPTWCFG